MYFNEQFDTIVYCIVDTVYAVLAGISMLTKEDQSLMLFVKSCIV